MNTTQAVKAPKLDLTAKLNFGFRKRAPVVLQTEAAECGLACLAMVAGYHGYHESLSSLRRRFGLSLKGATLANLIAFAQALNFSTRPLRLDLEHLPELKLPCVLHWDLNHFVVLRSVSRESVVIHDPARGMLKITLAEFSKHFTGVALELSPSAGFVTKKADKSLSIFDLMGRITGLKRAAVQVLMFAVALEVVALVMPFFMQWVVDGALVSADADLLTTLVTGFGLLVIVREIINISRAWVVTVLSTTLNVQWLANVFQHLLKLPVAWFEKRHLGDVVSRFESIHTLQRSLTTSFLEGAVDGVMAIVTLVMMAIYSMKLAAIVLAAMVIYTILRLALYRSLRHATEEHIVAHAKEHSHFLETVRGISSLKLFNRQEERAARHLNLVVDTMNRNIVTQRLALTWRLGNGVLFGLMGILIIWLGSKAVMESAFSVGMLFAFVAYKDQFVQRVSSLIDKAFEWRMMRLQGERLADIVTVEPESNMGETALMLEAANDAPAPSLTVKNLSFRYAPTEPWVLSDINFSIDSGESVAIIGASGGGKSTLAKAMLGLLQAEQGEVSVDGRSLKQIGIRQFRSMVGTVMQDDQLFAGSIAENIAFFDSAADQAWVEECARLAAVHDEIVAMPMTYNTLIGDMGTALSGGQRQRILLARALYKRPKILFLDEATSALDVQNEKLVNAAVKNLSLTRIIIAHRPETIAMADRVIVLQGGRVAQDFRKTEPKTANAA
jgi:ATP-binding cassette, subfamily B, bacterial CvaB/MchF/RaxB